MSADHDDVRLLMGGYLLGGLDAADTDRIDAHLRDCDRCREELDLLAPVPQLLQRLPAGERRRSDEPPAGPGLRPSPERIESLLYRMRAEKRRDRRVTRVRWLAAAAVVLVAAVVGVGVLADRRGGRTPDALPTPPRDVVARFDPTAGSALAGQATVTPKTWGVSVSLDVSRLEGEGPFVCQVRNTDGEVEQAAVWGETPTGSARVTGASSMQLKTVSTIAVTDHDGHVLGTARLS